MALSSPKRRERLSHLQGEESRLTIKRRKWPLLSKEKNVALSSSEEIGFISDLKRREGLFPR